MELVIVNFQRSHFSEHTLQLCLQPKEIRVGKEYSNSVLCVFKLGKIRGLRTRRNRVAQEPQIHKIVLNKQKITLEQYFSLKLRQIKVEPCSFGIQIFFHTSKINIA